MCYTINNLYFEGCFYAEDADFIEDFTTNNDDHVLLSENVMLFKEWKNDKRELKIGFNTSQREDNKILCKELNTFRVKLKSACREPEVVLDILLNLKCGPKSDGISVLLSSNV